MDEEFERLLAQLREKYEAGCLKGNTRAQSEVALVNRLLKEREIELRALRGEHNALVAERDTLFQEYESISLNFEKHKAREDALGHKPKESIYIIGTSPAIFTVDRVGAVTSANPSKVRKKLKLEPEQYNSISFVSLLHQTSQKPIEALLERIVSKDETLPFLIGSFRGPVSFLVGKEHAPCGLEVQAFYYDNKKIECFEARVLPLRKRAYTHSLFGEEPSLDRYFEESQFRCYPVVGSEE